MTLAIDLRVDVHSPIPIRRQLTEQLKHVIDTGGVPRDQALPSIRELAGFLGINPNTVARVVEDLKRSGYVEARRGSGVFVASAPPARPAPRLRETFLQDTVIRAAALGMTADDLAVGVLSLAGVRPAAVQGAVEVLLVECSPPELDFFAAQLEAQLPVRVDKVLLGELATIARRPKQPGRWRAAVTSFCHLPEVERLLSLRGIPVIALLAEAHLETLHQLAPILPTRPRMMSVFRPCPPRFMTSPATTPPRIPMRTHVTNIAKLMAVSPSSVVELSASRHGAFAVAHVGPPGRRARPRIDGGAGAP